MKLKRIFSIFLALALMLGALPALAVGEGDTPPVDVPASAATTTVTLTDLGAYYGAANVLVRITNGGNNPIDLTGITCTQATNEKVHSAQLSYEKPTIEAGESTELLMRLTGFGSDLTGSVTAVYKIVFSDGSAVGITKTASVTINFGEPNTGTPAPDGNPAPAFRLSALDANKKLVSTPSGNAGDKVTVRIPLYCLQGVDSVSITPKLSTSLDEFPFAIEQMDYTLYYKGGSVQPGEVIEVDYSLRLAKLVSAGVKKVDFIINYQTDVFQGGETLSTTVSIYVNVMKGYTEGGGSTPGVVSQPKLILEKYSVGTDKIYAGEEFEVFFTLKNTSSVEAVQNIQISIADTADTGKLLPAENGSNTIYIAKIDKGESYDVTYKMQSAADIEPKAYKLGLTLAYEGAKNIVAYTASDTISVTVFQKIRLKFDAPVFYDRFSVGVPGGVYLAMYNMGRSSVYNCMVSVEGEGLQMEETYFGGTVAAGGTMSADFSIIANTPGAIEGAIVVAYEDSLGEQMEERIPISLYVEDMGGGEIDGGFIDPGVIDPGFETDGGMTPGGGLPLWAWIAIGVGVLGCAATVLLVLKKKRRRNAEEV